MEGQGDMGLPAGDNQDLSLVARIRDDDYESRSGSDGASADEQDPGEERRPRKRYHRHTQHQIRELEAFFKECPHPDDKQRLDLSRKLGLENRQIKFWFQNRRTQMKTQLERHENMILRQENDKLRAENELLKQNITDPVCNNCGGPVVPGPVSFEQQQLRVENARLRDELNRVCALASKFLGRPVASSSNPVSLFGPSPDLALGVGRNGYDSLSNMDPTLPMEPGYNDGVAMPFMKQMPDAMGDVEPYNRSSFVNLALVAMGELIKLAQIDSPIWTKSIDGGKDFLNHEEYMRMFPPCIGLKPNNFASEGTRETGIVLINSLALVESLMDVNRWIEMFPSLIAGASIIEMISSGYDGTPNGTLQAMHAEFQVVSPLAPVRNVRFLRFSKQQAEGVWVVVDVSIDGNQDTSHAWGACRRLPSGCIIQDMGNGCSKVTWVEHSEYDESAVHQLYRLVISSGRGFGAQRWVATLQRYCECMVFLLSPTISGMNLSGTKSMLRLARRMVDSFCSGVCASSFSKWEQLHVGDANGDVKIFSRKNISDPGEPCGIVLSAATSLWLPVTRQRLFEFLRDERSRKEWDTLSNGGFMREFVHISKGQRHGNCVSLLHSTAANANANENSLILQETWNDASGSVIVYGPVDAQAMNIVMSGGDSTYVTLLPSGFVIIPDDSFNHGGPDSSTGTLAEQDSDGGDGCGSFLTVGLQISVDNQVRGKLTKVSVETVNRLISGTIQRIKAALRVA
uniref:Homeobox-leucine zipper protein ANTHOCYANINLESS 2 isoform X1 n=1 Tax=Rhizophora mucronata TaxID=61149 RepID=A0A2P2MXX5_RHIMU